jgi:hypothetical protein
VALVRTDVSEERITFIVRVTEICVMLTVTANVVPSPTIRVSLMMEAIKSSETSVPIRTTLRNIPGDGILHSHRHENLKSCTVRKQSSIL